MARSLKVSVVTETYPPDMNGVAITVAEIVAGLLAREHQLQLIRPRQHEADQGQSYQGFEEVLVPGIPMPSYPGQRMGWPSLGVLHQLWSQERPDVVHITTQGPLGWAALQVSCSLSIPVSTDFRTNFHSYSNHYGLGWLKQPILNYLRHFHNRSQRTMVPTEALRKELRRSGFRNLRVVARGVDTERFAPHHRDNALRSRWGASDQTLVVLCVGRLAAEKNLETLIQAFEAIRRQHPDSLLVLVGKGPLEKQLRARCPQAVLAGRRSGKELSAHYASADLFLFPSLTETFGNVTTEAMASGLPVVAFANGSASLLVRNGINGMLVDFGNNGAFVEAAVKLATQRAQLPSHGLAARHSTLPLKWSTVVERFERELISLTVHRKAVIHNTPVMPA